MSVIINEEEFLPGREAAYLNKALQWIFTPLRYVKTSEFKRYL